MRQLTGTTSSTEPLANYRGVVWRTELIRRRDGWRTVQLIDLCHEDPSKTVNLFSSTDTAAVRDVWQDWAQALDLVAIRWTAASTLPACSSNVVRRERPASVAPRRESLGPRDRKHRGRASFRGFAGQGAAGYLRVVTADAEFRAAPSAAIATCSAWLRISATEMSSQKVPRTIGPAPNSLRDGCPSRPIKAP